MNLIPRDQLPKCIAGFSSIGLVVFDNQLDLLAEDAAFGIDFFYSHNHSINYRQAIGCHWTGGRAYNSNLEGFRRPYHQCRGHYHYRCKHDGQYA